MTESQKKIVLFASMAHAGQLNPVLSIAQAFWNTCDQDVYQIHFLCTDDVQSKVMQALPQAKFVSCGPENIAATAVQDSDYYEHKLKTPPMSLSAIKDVVGGLALNSDQYERDFQGASQATKDLSTKPVLAVVDGVMAGFQDAIRVAGIPRVAILPFNSRSTFDDPGLLGFWDFPTIGTGYSANMSLWEKICNRIYTLLVRLSIVVVAIRFLQKRVALAQVTMEEASADCLGIGDAEHIVVASIFGFEYPYELPPNVTMVGACINDKLIEEQFQNSLHSEPTLQWISQHHEVVYVGLGTLTKPSKAYLRNLLTAFQQVRQERPDLHMLCKVPEGCYRPDEDDTILQNVRLVHRVHSQLEVLRHSHVRVFVSHCGGNGVHEGIYFGKAILGIPQWLDCYDFAQRVQDSRVGLRVQTTVPVIQVEEVASKLLQLVVDEKYQLASKNLGHKMKEAGGIHRTIEIINQQLESSADSGRSLM